jgi:glycosyltransferase involved in cell wall biosynthesis
MKLVIDLQAAQGANRHREIGRYSLAFAEAMVRRAGVHEVIIALSDAFPDTIESLRATFDPLLAQEQIVVWDAPTPLAENNPANGWRHKAGKILRETFLASLRPDIVYVPSLLEGYDDDAVVSVGARAEGAITALALHDVVPLYERDITEAKHTAWYENKLSCVRQAGLWLSPSEASRRQYMGWLSLPSERVINISMAAPAYLRPMQLTEDRASSIRQQYGLTRPFLLCAGSAGSYDDLDSLIGAYARLDESVRHGYQVLVTGIAENGIVVRLRQRMEQLGLAHDGVVFVSSIPNSDLGAFYNLASAFCLPGLSSGFGMAGLEAMQCGTAIVGANLPGLSEIIGRSDALFDPGNDADIATRLHQVLADEPYRRSLSEHGLRQAQKFTWDECARRAWDAFEAAHDRKNADHVRANLRDVSTSPGRSRLRLAYVSPLLPEKNGGADLSSQLVPELSRHYEIDVVTDQSEIADPWIKANCSVRNFSWFNKNTGQYDRILYHLGDEQFYSQISDLLHQHPGVVALHDFFLCGVPADENAGNVLRGSLDRGLYYARGYTALIDQAHATTPARSPSTRPTDVSVLQNATGIIFNSDEVKDQARQYYGEELAYAYTVISDGQSPPEMDNSVSLREVADRYFAAIESFSRSSSQAVRAQVVTAVTAANPKYENESDWLSVARAIARNLPSPGIVRQLLVDVSELVQRDVGTGIQRVTRSILKELLINPPKGYRVEPVYAQPNKPGYRYARDFTLRFLNRPNAQLEDTAVETRLGDIFLGLDLQREVVAGQQDFYSSMRRMGGKVYFVIYDMLPILLPHAFPEGTVDQHTRWLSILARHSDGLVCISRSVADELFVWLKENGAQSRLRPLQIGWFHLGADIDMSVPTRGIPDRGDEILASLGARPSFLAVGTIEPRKGYAQLLKAFQQLWAEGVDVNLTIVGRQGWNVDEITEALRSHPEFGKRLLWLEGISDEYLERIYTASACLIAASEGEGFGLPLIEAARHRIPILARDIPVFHEVAGEHMSYFAGPEPDNLARAVKDWLVLYGEDRHPKSGNMPWLSWAESAERLKDVLLKNSWYKTWPYDKRAMGIRQTNEQKAVQDTERAETHA